MINFLSYINKFKFAPNLAYKRDYIDFKEYSFSYKIKKNLSQLIKIYGFFNYIKQKLCNKLINKNKRKHTVNYKKNINGF